MVHKWKDKTQFSQGNTDRIPRTWVVQLGCFRLVVHRYINYPPDQWLASCHGVFDKIELKSKDIDGAKREAIMTFRNRLTTAYEVSQEV